MKMSPAYEPSSENVKKIVFDVTKTSPKKAEKYVKYFDELGNLTHFIRLNYKNDTLEEGFFSFIDKDKLTKSTVYKNSKLTFSTLWTYDQKQKLIAFVRENGKKKVQSMGKWTRNEKSFTTESVLYKKDTTKFCNKWVHEFNADDSPAKTTLYQKNGKIKRIWSYHCNPLGEKVEKNEVLFCRDTHSDDQYSYASWRIVGEKGKVEKIVNKYTLKDHLLLESSTYNESELLLHRSIYDQSEDRLLSSISYDKKGNQSVSYFYTYENQRPVSYKFYIGKKNINE